MNPIVFHFNASRFCRATILVASAAVIFSGCSEKKTNPDVVATVGNREITVADFKQEIEWRRQNERPLPDKEVLLGEMISRELSLQKAKALGLEKDRDVQRTYEDILASKLRERELAARLTAVKVSEEELRADYKRNLQHYTQPAKARLSLICVKTDRKMSEEKIAGIESRMGEILKLAKALPEGSRGFDRVAVDFSEDQASRYKGGDVGWFDDGASLYRWPTEVVQAGFGLKIGEVSEVIKAPDGFYLVKKMDARDSVVAPFEQVQATIQHRLLAQKRQETEAAFARDLQSFAPVQTNEETFAGLDYPKTTVAAAPEFKPPALPRSP
jgi:parvulin-like peptidyl-prolyl isomerase